MKNIKKLTISCLILFLTAIGCSDYIEFAEKENQAEREYLLRQYDGYEDDEKESGFLIYYDGEQKQNLETYKDNPLIDSGNLNESGFLENEQGYSPVKEKEPSEIVRPNLKKSTKEDEISEKRRKTYWDRIREQEQNK